ncbi:MAG: RagB/SusD family nutrient uptake outer membrane protein [Prolixibacteraceae bacterium]
MKNLKQILFGLIVLSVMAISCDSLLDVRSERFMFPENHKIDSPNDSIYSMIGIFTRLQKLGDSYVLLGELRGDLMDITENAGLELREINNFEIPVDNPYNVIEDYYSVINHCNYLINNIDTSFTAGGEKSLYKEYAAAKAIRAWTYLQIVLNYGKARYYTEPILTVQAAQANFPEYSIHEMVPALIKDLEPVKKAKTPGRISLGVDMSSDKLFFPIPLLLGDLYLWNGQFENAAREYYSLIEENRYVIDDRYSSVWTVDNGVFVQREIIDQNYLEIFDLTNREQITLIAGSTEMGEEDELYKMTIDNYALTTSQVAKDYWNQQLYYYNENATIAGDLRGSIGSYIGEGYHLGGLSDENAILKYYMIHSNAQVSKAIMIYRVATLYLRYAEAVNRAGKPNLAFAVLKHGMNPESLAVDTIVPRHEKYSVYTDSTGTYVDYINFSNIAFEENIGVHSRGCGNMDKATDYVIPALNSKQDSILYVEDKIVEELALETAFEGNRFQDLMRIAMRRNDPAFLANKVAAKHTGNEQAIRSKLMDENNWYLKK